MGEIAIIVAGGEGLRMGSSLPKQFHLVHGKPILFYTLEAFLNSRTCPEIYLIMHKEHIKRWIDLCKSFNFHEPHILVEGGNSRSESVSNGMQHIQDKIGSRVSSSWIGIHDAVRPLVSSELIDRSFESAKKFGSAVPCLTLSDSLRILKEKGSEAIDREIYRITQTPQVFSGESILLAYQNRGSENFSDDASLFEKSGGKIHLIEGERQNIKITYPLDLEYSEFIINKRNSIS